MQGTILTLVPLCFAEPPCCCCSGFTPSLVLVNCSGMVQPRACDRAPSKQGQLREFS